VKRIEFSTYARRELEEAATRYEDDYPGRGKRFGAAVKRATRLIARFAEAGPSYPGVDGTRRIRVARFPFFIVFRVVESVIRIEAVAHMHRHPDYWRK